MWKASTSWLLSLQSQKKVNYVEQVNFLVCCDVTFLWFPLASKRATYLFANDSHVSINFLITSLKLWTKNGMETHEYWKKKVIYFCACMKGFFQLFDKTMGTVTEHDAKQSINEVWTERRKRNFNLVTSLSGNTDSVQLSFYFEQNFNRNPASVKLYPALTSVS